jgi:hypothetical protein
MKQGTDRILTTHAGRVLQATRETPPRANVAYALPCGLSDGLPAGLMLIGKAFDESTIYRAAHAFEQSHDWMKVTA